MAGARAHVGQWADGDERRRIGAAADQVVRAVTEDRLCHRRTDECGEHEQDDEDAARQRNAIAPQSAPHLLPVAAGANVFELSQLPVALDRDVGDESRAGGNVFLSLLSRRNYGIAGSAPMCPRGAQ
jgi:hypothetical protein